MRAIPAIENETIVIIKYLIENELSNKKYF